MMNATVFSPNSQSSFCIHISLGKQSVEKLICGQEKKFSSDELYKNRQLVTHWLFQCAPGITNYPTFDGDPNSYFSVKLCVTFQTQCMEETEIKKVKFYKP